MFTSGYMDDITFGSNVRDVTRDVDHIRTEGEAIGLYLNNEKCEIISRSNTSKLTQAGSLWNWDRRIGYYLVLCLSQAVTLDSCLENKICKLCSAISRLCLLLAQEAIIILRSSFNIPRLMHILRCSPCFDHSLLQMHDTGLREGLSAI